MTRMFPVGIQTFEKLRKENDIYIDKTDLVWKMPNAIYVIEIKVNGSAQEAIDQINSKSYAFPYLRDERRVIKAGVKK